MKKQYSIVPQGKYPKYYCYRCGALCIIGKAIEDYDSETGERNYKYWLRCPNWKRLTFQIHTNEGAHLLDKHWTFSSGWY